MDEPALDGEDGSDGPSPEEAFALLSDETRLAILRALYEADGPLTFSALRRRVDMEDSGRFNYHLEKLVGHFVRGIEADGGDAAEQASPGGYELRYAGEQIVRAVLAGVVGPAPTLEPTEIDERCPYCGAPVEMRYRDETITARCTDCPGVVVGEFPAGTFMHYGFPPAGFRDRSLEGALDAAHVLYDSKITPMMNGVCPECAGRTTVEVDVCEDHEVTDGGLCEACDTRFRVWTTYTCENCRYARRSAMWFKLLTHPAVIAFYHEHGGLEATIPFNKLSWENAPYIRAISEEVLQQDPLRIAVTISLGGATLSVTVDDDLDVVDLQREE